MPCPEQFWTETGAASQRQTPPSALATFHPNAALGLLFLETGRHEAALQFAESAVAGLTSYGLHDHRARLMAAMVQGVAQFRLGRADLAEPALRNVDRGLSDGGAGDRIYGRALATLARVVSRLDTPDEEVIRRAFLDGLSAAWSVPAEDVLQVRSLQLQYEEDHGTEPAMLLPRVAALETDAAGAGNISDMQRAFYTGYHGHILSRLGRYGAAEAKLRQQYEVYLTAGAVHADTWENIRQLGTVMVFSQGAQAGYDFLLSEHRRMQELQAPADELALVHRDLGRIANGAGNAQLAQIHFREAYVTARKAFAATAPISVHLRRFLDPVDDGMAGFDLRSELATPGFAPLLRADGAHVLFLFLDGRYLALGDWFARNGPGVPDQDTALYLINRALYHALIRRTQEMMADLQAAQDAARRGSGNCRQSIAIRPVT